ncbi:glycosyltransferase family 4 protein [Sediminibacterium ginsengisoli]|uniref:Glycosyltransferase involved in cell wall bisynthesis n=1 Tax=Sediminibacterium ginsengisoli TaxID=413434 RepID=A0A1T4PPD2_9BACT|nr:glycosyltransferase family 4 protein [Sediminibacterium ginsengisoli]SJZ93430.1 Glycosyltransferase involved in cell wall bisynthesis [Sediminibacterium ginsengisoli]
MNNKVIIIGPAWPLRGGLASFDERLAKQFSAQGFDTSIYTFSLQYPDFLFPGTTQYSSEPAPEGIDIRVKINSINPFNWYKVGRELRKMAPALIVVRFWLPLMGPCLGSILRIVRKNRKTKIICLVDNIKPHEKRPGDIPFTRYFVKSIDAFLTMSEQVKKDLTGFTAKPAALVPHPLFDNFGVSVPKNEARKKLGLDPDDKIILFFGFIRKYKGLDMLLKAMADERIRRSGIRLMIAGEFYEDRKEYDELIRTLNIGPKLILHTDFIPDSEVRYYMSAADFVIQPYHHATQSGVTPLAYHFEKPTLVTNVGGLPELVPHEKAGIVAEPDPQSIASGILRLYELGEPLLHANLLLEKRKYSWETFTSALLTLAGKKGAGGIIPNS